MVASKEIWANSQTSWSWRLSKIPSVPSKTTSPSATSKVYASACAGKSCLDFPDFSMARTNEPIPLARSSA
eukprot:Skav214600  [mRNA]  locus=scaffold57:600666:603147:+ [translate_table: standard]